ncbi:CxxH/CxxC protein [Cytobacillus citreus]
MKGWKKMIYSCEEHIDIAIDTVVDEHETFPILTKISEGEKLSTTCEYCRNSAVYLVANE